MGFKLHTDADHNKKGSFTLWLCSVQRQHVICYNDSLKLFKLVTCLYTGSATQRGLFRVWLPSGDRGGNNRYHHKGNLYFLGQKMPWTWHVLSVTIPFIYLFIFLLQLDFASVRLSHTRHLNALFGQSCTRCLNALFGQFDTRRVNALFRQSDTRLHGSIQDV